MRRRDFLRLSALASSSLFLEHHGVAQAPAARLTLDPQQAGNRIGKNFTGLSYETAQLGDPEFFSSANTDLVGLIQRLGRSGVLRIGGNTSEYSQWKQKGSSASSAVAPDAHTPVGPDTGKQPPKPTVITPTAIRNLRSFTDVTGWKLIYGLNMGTESPETAAAEAAFVFQAFGPELVAFQLCNEPDLFHKNGIRQAGYDYAQFAKEWRQFYEVIKKAVPDAPFAGPDTAFNNEWLLPFAKEFREDIVFLSQHYYAEGPPTDPSMTIDRLLRPNPKLIAEFEGMAQTRKDTGLLFRLAETNSCYSGGKQGVSDTFASALWAPELMYQLAEAGGDGINFHGGGLGWYTPIAGTLEKGFSARPIYYGMLLFAEAGAGQLIASKLDYVQDVPLLTAYSLRTDNGRIKTVIFNKHQDRSIQIAIDPGQAATYATVLQLTAPAITSTSGVTLGNAAVDSKGAWNPQPEERVTLQQNRMTMELRASSAALVSFHS